MALKGKIGIPNEITIRDIKNAHKWIEPQAPDYKGNFSFVDACAGVGGFRIALEGLPERDGKKGFSGLGGKCVFTIENDPACIKTYSSNFGETSAVDVTRLDMNKIPDLDVFCGGFPCQTFSILGRGKRKSLGLESGLKDPTKGSIFKHFIKIFEEKRPSILLLENVVGIESDDHGKTIRTIRSELRDIGYEVFDSSLTSVFWVPQHRKRMVFVGFDAQRYGLDLIRKHWNGFPAYPVLEGLPRMFHILEIILMKPFTLRMKHKPGFWLTLISPMGKKGASSRS